MGKMFEDDNGNASSMRLMSFVSLIASIMFGILTMYLSNQDGLILTAMFIVGAFAPKVVQKFAENMPKRGV
jgi:positive regulator of sigma E activity